MPTSRGRAVDSSPISGSIKSAIEAAASCALATDNPATCTVSGNAEERVSGIHLAIECGPIVRVRVAAAGTCAGVAHSKTTATGRLPASNLRIGLVRAANSWTLSTTSTNIRASSTSVSPTKPATSIGDTMRGAPAWSATCASQLKHCHSAMLSVTTPSCQSAGPLDAASCTTMERAMAAAVRGAPITAVTDPGVKVTATGTRSRRAARAISFHVSLVVSAPVPVINGAHVASPMPIDTMNASGSLGRTDQSDGMRRSIVSSARPRVGVVAR